MSLLILKTLTVYREYRYYGKPIISIVRSIFKCILFFSVDILVDLLSFFPHFRIFRQVFGFQTTPRNRIIELEQIDDWMSALLEYGSIQFNCPVGKENASFMPSAVVKSEGVGDLIGMRSERGIVRVKEDKRENSVIDMTMDISTDGENAQLAKEEKGIKESGGEHDEKHVGVDTIGNRDMDEEENEKSLCDAWKACSDLERGRLRCLLELGHLDAVVDQTMGMTLRAPQLESTLVPLGIEAAWKLMKWDDLDNFLERIDGPCTFNSTSSRTHGLSYGCSSFNSSDFYYNSSSSGVSGHRGRLGISILPEDGFQVSVGRLMRSMVRRDADSFWTELADARSQVITRIFFSPSCPPFIYSPCTLSRRVLHSILHPSSLEAILLFIKFPSPIFKCAIVPSGRCVVKLPLVICLFLFLVMRSHCLTHQLIQYHSPALLPSITPSLPNSLSHSLPSSLSHSLTHSLTD